MQKKRKLERPGSDCFILEWSIVCTLYYDQTTLVPAKLGALKIFTAFFRASRPFLLRLIGDIQFVWHHFTYLVPLEALPCSPGGTYPWPPSQQSTTCQILLCLTQQPSPMSPLTILVPDNVLSDRPSHACPPSHLCLLSPRLFACLYLALLS